MPDVVYDATSEYTRRSCETWTGEIYWKTYTGRRDDNQWVIEGENMEKRGVFMIRWTIASVVEYVFTKSSQTWWFDATRRPRKLAPLFNYL